MQMTDVREKLQSLQEILSEKYKLEKERNDAPNELTVQEGLLERQRKQFLEKNTQYEEIKAKVNSLQIELHETEKIREDGEKGMDNISTHREYEALDKQISDATAKEAEIRKQLDKEKKHLNELNEALKFDETLIKNQETDLEARKVTMGKQISKLDSQLEKLTKKEAQITEGLDAEIVSKFQRIIQRNSEGIVAVKNGVCEGCHMILPAQYANEVHEGENILFCPYCSRILFYKESEENEEEYYTMTEAGSLSDFEDDYDDEGIDSENNEYSEEDGYDDSSDYDDEDDDDDEKNDSDEESEEN